MGQVSNLLGKDWQVGNLPHVWNQFSTMSRIHQLDSSVVNKIAAGEVIERPANVVKELLVLRNGDATH